MFWEPHGAGTGTLRLRRGLPDSGTAFPREALTDVLRGDKRLRAQP